MPNRIAGNKETVMSGLTTQWVQPPAPRDVVKRLLVWVPAVLAVVWFGLCVASVLEFGRIGFLMLARPSLYLGLILFVVSIGAFWLLPKPRARRDGFALALSLAGSGFTVMSFAVASRIVG
jgi:hypothetical protein